jgi:hypothetical protein
MTAEQQPTVYRGVEIFRNFTSTNGTGRRLRKQRGWNLNLDGYGSLGWCSSMADARSHIDYLHDVDRAPAVARALGIPHSEAGHT